MFSILLLFRAVTSPVCRHYLMMFLVGYTLIYFIFQRPFQRFTLHDNYSETLHINNGIIRLTSMFSSWHHLVSGIHFSTSPQVSDLYASTPRRTTPHPNVPQKYPLFTPPPQGVLTLTKFPSH